MHSKVGRAHSPLSSVGPLVSSLQRPQPDPLAACPMRAAGTVLGACRRHLSPLTHPAAYKPQETGAAPEVVGSHAGHDGHGDHDDCRPSSSARRAPTPVGHSALPSLPTEAGHGTDDDDGDGEGGDDYVGRHRPDGASPGPSPTGKVGCVVQRGHWDYKGPAATSTNAEPSDIAPAGNATKGTSAFTSGPTGAAVAFGMEWRSVVGLVGVVGWLVV